MVYEYVSFKSQTSVHRGSWENDHKLHSGKSYAFSRQRKQFTLEFSSKFVALIFMSFEKLKADRLHPRDYPHMPTNYTQTNTLDW